MDFVELGQRVAAWGAPLSYTASPLRAGCVIANTGGETRYYVRRSEAGIVVTSATRSAAEVFEMVSDRAEDGEKFLISVFGAPVRSEVMRDAFALRLPFFEDELAAPFRLHAEGGGERHVAVWEDGCYRASFASTVDAVRFTHYANAPVEMVMAAFLDTTGRGLFPLDTTRFASGHRVPETG